MGDGTAKGDANQIFTQDKDKGYFRNKGKGEIRGFWLRQNDGQEQNQIPPLHCGMTNQKATTEILAAPE